MASERDLELLDDYISNRLTGKDKAYIEERLQQDPDLQSEYAIQQQIAAGVRKARAAELKQLLNNIPTPSLTGNGFSYGKAAGAVLVALFGLSLLYFLFQHNDEPTPSAVVETVSTAEPAVGDDATGSVPEEADVDREETEKVKVQPSPAPAKRKTERSETRKNIEVFDPSAENASAEQHIPGPAEVIEDNRITDTEREVLTDGSNKKYRFHYQIVDNKVILYGTFEKNLYHILEFISDDKRTVFLYYKDNYYLLNGDNKKINPLVPVNDPVLLKKLRESRAR